MRTIILIIFIHLVFTLDSNSENSFDNYISNVKMNSKSLIDARNYTEFLKSQANTGLYPSDPELSGGYFNGSPTSMGNMFTYEIVQSFDFPTVYFQKNKLSDELELLAELKYLEFERRELIEAGELFFELVYLNKKIEVLEEKLKNAKQISDHFKKKLDINNLFEDIINSKLNYYLRSMLYYVL